MTSRKSLRLDEIGYWSEIKLEIIKDYAQAYSQIMSSEKQQRFTHVYIDGFAGPGVHISETTGALVEGSPLNALQIHPPFREFHLIDLDGDKITTLKKVVGARPDVFIYHGDANRILLEQVFPRVHYEDFRRGLCLLDPYGLHLDWAVMEAAGRLMTIDLFLNFPIMDMNMNALWSKPEKVSADQSGRMDAFWGDHSWRDAAYEKQETLFGPKEEKAGNEAVVFAFRERLKKVAQFKNVPEPLPMRNSKGAVVYYLFFASQKPVAKDIVQHIFRKYKLRGRI
jgi:three-Cys-motif partner protein